MQYYHLIMLLAVSLGVTSVVLMGCFPSDSPVHTPTTEMVVPVSPQVRPNLDIAATTTPTPEVSSMPDDKVNRELVDRDRRALVALYNATNGPDWTNDWNWLSDKPLDEWNGVTTDDFGQVVEIHFGCSDGNNLSGNIPPELGNLSEISLLALGCNDLTGSVPPELGSLTKLITFTIHSNKLTGELPQGLTRLSKLHQFNWYQDSVEGDELCAPLNSIQDWLREIEFEFGGPTCPRR